MSSVYVEKQKIDLLANAISAKSGVPVTMTLDGMVAAVDGIEAGESPVEAGYVSEPDMAVVDQGHGEYAVEAVVDVQGGLVETGTLTGSLSLVNYLQTGASATPSGQTQYFSPGSGKVGFFDFTVAAMPAGTAGTPTATKGSVSNHSVTVTPSVTNTAGYITGGTVSGTGVTVSASELVSGNRAITENGTNIDVTNYATVSVDIDFVTYHTSTSAPTSSDGSDGDIWLVTS